MKKAVYALGMMSGSSLDGIDLAFCRFYFKNNTWLYSIEIAETVEYTDFWRAKLMRATDLPSNELLRLDVEFGKFLGETAAHFIVKNQLKPDLVASHGHTLFHEPGFGYSFQLGRGAFIARQTATIVVSDFRNADIYFGGQGAPLVPVGDELLFGEYKACVNIGGIANLSYSGKGVRKGYDICGANQLLNTLSTEIGLPYDAGGKLAASGIVDVDLFEKLNSDSYFIRPAPKSLSNQYVVENFVSVLADTQIPLSNRLAAAVSHISHQMAHALNQIPVGRVLVTGGGAHNHFLFGSIQSLTPHELVVPEDRLVDFKEAMVFAFMGVLRIQNQVNCLASVTGASCDSLGGVIHLP
ncbi:MAG: anhydro-N-acetylmuramic acid kinase [Bacteroidales bacterium]|jgi:anhydro-N-acetylmuramic acid kinase